MKFLTTFIISLAIIIFLFLSACSPVADSPALQTQPEQATANTAEQEAIAPPADCAKLNMPFKDFCTFRTASSSLNPELCAAIADDNLIAFCYDHIEKLQDQDAIEEKLAEKTVAACQTLSEDNLRFTCISKLAKLEKNAVLCKEANVLQDACEIVVAGETGNAEICKGKTGKSSDYCYYAAATQSLNDAYCASIALETQRKSCYLTVATKKGDATSCAKTENEKLCIALASGDAKQCETLGDELKKDVCVRNLAQQKEDAGLCKKLEAKNMVECITGIAAKTQNTSLCELTGDFEPFCLNKVELSR